MTEEKGGRTRKDPIGRASGNLEKALETISKRLLEQIKDGETPSRELGELAKVMKQAVEIRQELQEEHGGWYLNRKRRNFRNDGAADRRAE